MAGFFGLFDYTKPGKGVRKDEPQKKRIVHFFELFFRKFWKLIQLNLLYLLFCIPIVTIGPATAGFTYVLRNMANEQPIFLFSDFWDAFKQNWKQSFAYSLLMLICTILVTVSVKFYTYNLDAHKWMYVPAALSLFVALVLILMSFYVMLMIVTLDLPLKAILKNAAILSIVCLKTNLLTLLFTGILVVACILFFPISLLFVIFIIPALVGFIVCFNSYKGIKKYAIDPFLAAQAEKEQEDEDSGLVAMETDGDTVFRDEEPTQTL